MSKQQRLFFSPLQEGVRRCVLKMKQAAATEKVVGLMGLAPLREGYSLKVHTRRSDAVLPSCVPHCRAAPHAASCRLMPPSAGA